MKFKPVSTVNHIMMTVVNKKNKRIEIVLQKPLNKLACAYFTSKAAAAAGARRRVLSSVCRCCATASRSSPARRKVCCEHVRPYAHVCSRMLTDAAYVCCRMLTYGGNNARCGARVGPPQRAREHGCYGRRWRYLRQAHLIRTPAAAATSPQRQQRRRAWQVCVCVCACV